MIEMIALKIKPSMTPNTSKVVVLLMREEMPIISIVVRTAPANAAAVTGIPDRRAPPAVTAVPVLAVAIADISPDRSEVEEFVKECNENGIEPERLTEAAEDYLLRLSYVPVNN